MTMRENGSRSHRTTASPDNAIDLPDGQITDSCPAPLRKIFRFSADPNQLYKSRHPVPHRGAFRDRHGRWVRDAVDAAASGARMACWTNDADADGGGVWSRRPHAGG